MYEVTLSVGTKTVAGFDNLATWGQVKGAVADLENHYDLSDWDIRCVVRFTDSARTVIGTVTGSEMMEAPLLVYGLMDDGEHYQTLLWDMEQAKAVADSLSFARVFDLTREHFDEMEVYSGGYDRDFTRVLVNPETGKLLPC